VCEDARLYVECFAALSGRGTARHSRGPARAHVGAMHVAWVAVNARNSRTFRVCTWQHSGSAQHPRFKNGFVSSSSGRSQGACMPIALYSPPPLAAFKHADAPCANRSPCPPNGYPHSLVAPSSESLLILVAGTIWSRCEDRRVLVGYLLFTTSSHWRRPLAQELCSRRRQWCVRFEAKPPPILPSGKVSCEQLKSRNGPGRSDSFLPCVSFLRDLSQVLFLRGEEATMFRCLDS